jgi:antitoxin MazE
MVVVLTMRARVQRWGNSLAFRIPRAFGRELNLRPESPVEITVDDGRLILHPVAETGVASLEQLLEAVTDDNLHTEVDTGPSVGREMW